MAELLDDVLMASIDGICIFDRAGRCTHWSGGLERLTGVAAAQALGRSKAELFPEGQRPFTLSFRAAAGGGEIGVARSCEASIDELLSLASHTLKTPLAALQLHLGAQLRAIGRGQLDRDALERSTASAIEQAMRMADTINLLVDVARIDSGWWRLDGSDFELGQVARQAAGRLQQSAREAGCEVRLDLAGELHVRWDRARIEEVLATLLAHAFRHGAGRPVDVVVRGRGERVHLEVADHGPGLTPEELAQLFTRGPRTALGLWLVKEIIRAHQGTLAVTSAAGAGSRFTLELPRVAP